MKRRRLAAALVITPATLMIGLWFFYWCRRCAAFWGAVEAPAAIIGGLFALCVLAVLLIKPIPIKASAIAAAYLLLFSLLAEGVFSAAGLLSPFFIRLRDGGLMPPIVSAACLLHARVHSQKTVLTHYRIASSRIAARLRIALVSDVHMGLSVDEKRLQAAADTLSLKAPDILVVAGDLVDDYTTPEQMEAACRILGQVKADRGVWFVYGNHDIAAVGPRLNFSPEYYRNTLIKNGIHILDDEVALLPGSVALAGRLDAWGEEDNLRLPLTSLLQGVDPTLPVILIDHQPVDLAAAAKAGVLLQLSGHTHGGQVWPMGMLSALLRPASLVYGHRCLDGCHVIVSAGLGTRGSRLRSGCTAETVLIDLLPESAETVLRTD